MRSLIVVLFLVGGCGSPCQQIKATRCSGNVVEICGSNMRWQRVLSCSEIVPFSPKAPKAWMCGKTTTGYTCIPRSK
jgi:hypothetical protein